MTSRGGGATAVVALVLQVVGDVGEGARGDAGARHESHALVRLADRQLQRRLLGKTVRLCNNKITQL